MSQQYCVTTLVCCFGARAMQVPYIDAPWMGIHVGGPDALSVPLCWPLLGPVTVQTNTGRAASTGTPRHSRAQSKLSASGQTSGLRCCTVVRGLLGTGPHPRTRLAPPLRIDVESARVPGSYLGHILKATHIQNAPSPELWRMRGTFAGVCHRGSCEYGVVGSPKFA